MVKKEKGYMENFKSILDGLMLSDGSIERRKIQHNARYSHECIHYNYSIYIKNLLNSNNVSCSDFYPKVRFYGKNRNNGYRVCSLTSQLLTEQHERWYKNRKKIIPKDVSLDPETFCHWFCGDGWLSWNTKYSTLHSVFFATEGFTKEDIEYLLERILKIGFKFRIDSRNNIFLKASLAKDLMNYIGECPIDCFKYKWEILDRKKYLFLKNYCSCTRDNQQRSILFEG